MATLSKLAEKKKPTYNLVFGDVKLRLVKKKEEAILLKKHAPKEQAWKFMVWDTAGISEAEIHQAIMEIIGIDHPFKITQSFRKQKAIPSLQ